MVYEDPEAKQESPWQTWQIKATKIAIHATFIKYQIDGKSYFYLAMFWREQAK